MQAKWWETQSNNGERQARCSLCVHNCIVPQGKEGYCGVRFFDGEKLFSPLLGRFCSLAIDPIEKKPLYHWQPGTSILSLGSLGCTMRCPFCQNHSIAQPDKDEKNRIALTSLTAEDIVNKARSHGLTSVAYTYNEPALQAEYILAAAPVLKKAGLATVLVSNGMYSEALLHAFCACVDAVNIDYKCHTAKDYARLGGSLETVRRSIAALHSAGVHVEVTTLIVPGVSDNPEGFAETVHWLADVSETIPLHISRYRPAFKYTAPPTDVELLLHFAAIAKVRLKNVHIGNVPYLRGQAAAK
ncbi:radical SAM protein [Desulfovibrio sp. OttesenSCG-928-G15]|nr:radical SAM protein [Desulfovibrio sp. OttesenSCG-928-G15]